MIDSGMDSKCGNVAGMPESKDEAKEWDWKRYDSEPLAGSRGESLFFLIHQSLERLPSESDKAKDLTTHSSREADKMQWLVGEQLGRFLAIEAHPKALQIRDDKHDFLEFTKQLARG
jgi:hypothetical protein